MTTVLCLPDNWKEPQKVIPSCHNVSLLFHQKCPLNHFTDWPLKPNHLMCSHLYIE